jgi:2-polyprenyl-3-methyl-5-hydroxy-6-metoxy-1,4-benzoquinol methylase
VSVHSRYEARLRDQRQFFDELIVDEWESYKNEAWDHTRRFEVDRILEKVRPRRILDIGCGCGFHDIEFARRPFVERVDAIDYSPRSVEKANEAYPHEKVFRRVADLAADRVEAGYDLVVSFQVIEHLPDADEYFKYAVAACRPGGVVAIVTPNGARLDNRIRRWRGQEPSMLDTQHFREYSRRELVDIGRLHGLQPAGHFGHTLHSFLYPRIVAADYQRRTRLGAMLPGIANVIGVLLRKGH